MFLEQMTLSLFNHRTLRQKTKCYLNATGNGAIMIIIDNLLGKRKNKNKMDLLNSSSKNTEKNTPNLVVGVLYPHSISKSIFK